jgi:hypothetical protein
MPLYGLMPAPGTSPIASSPGAAGADFSQVYTSALALRNGQSAYHPTNRPFRDRYGRHPNYPPLTNWLYVPVSKLPYYQALLVHSGLSLLVFLGTTALLLSQAGLFPHFWRVVLVTMSLYFLTPIGLTHIERGQFDLYVATSFVACLACVVGGPGRLRWAVAAGLLGALKWTAAPFLGCFAAAGWLVSRRAARWVWPVIPLVLAVATALFWREVREYLDSLQHYELGETPNGVSLQLILPRFWARAAPVLLTLAVSIAMLGFIRSGRERYRIFVSISLPFALALANLALSFGTLSFEYRTVSLLGLIPPLVVWVESEPWVSIRSKGFTCAAFGLFLVLTFRVFGFSEETVTCVDITRLYAGFALLFFGQCLGLLVTLIRASAPWPAPGSPEPG